MRAALRRPSKSGRAGVALVALALALALAAWWLSRGPAPDAVAPSPAASVRESDSRAPLEEGSVPADATPPRAAASVPDAATLDDAAEPLDATPRDPVDVLVVDAATGAPIAGAEVRWANMSETGLPVDPARPRWIADPIAMLEGGRRATTDERGIARLDSRVFPGWVLAMRGDRWGRSHADEHFPRPIRVELGSSVDLAIQVVDAKGTPVAGVPVCLRDVPHLDSLGEMWQGTTEGPDGIARARLQHVAPRPGRDPGTAYACLEVPLRDALCVPVDLANPPSDPVQLVLPPCGSVVVQMRDSSGAPPSILALILGYAEKVDGQGDFDWGARTFEPESMRDGEARYPFVGLGLDLHVTAMAHGTNAKASGPGPHAAGEVVRFDLDLGDPAPVLTGRLVTRSGEPIRQRLVQFGVETKSAGGSSGTNSSPIRTDVDGRFRVPFSGKAGSAASVALLVQPIGIGAGEGGSAHREFALADVPIEIDLGDLVVAMPHVVGAGVVVDDLGQPVRGATLSIHASRPEVENGAWRNDPLVRAVMRPDGSFEIRSTVDVARLRVAAMRRDHAESERVEFEPGRRDLRLVAPRACELSGRALLDEGVDGQRIRVRVLVPGAPLPTERLGTDREVRIGVDGAFRIAPLPPGRYDLDFRFLANGVPFHRIEGIEVAPAGKSVDARLDAVDLRGKVPAGTR